jgi:adenine deaminase
VAREGEPLFTPYQAPGSSITNTVNVKPFDIEALRLSASGETGLVIKVIPDQIITQKREERVKVSGSAVVSDTERDILKLVVVERHRATGNIGLGLVMGFGLKRGALASSIAHDAHNIVAVGVNDEDTFIAVKEIERLQGGLVAATDGRVLASLALPVAGLLSNEPLYVVVGKLQKLERVVNDLGCTLPTPFATLSFLALPTIPELRLTDLGLVDVSEFRLVK